MIKCNETHESIIIVSYMSVLSPYLASHSTQFLLLDIHKNKILLKFFCHYRVFFVLLHLRIISFGMSSFYYQLFITLIKSKERGNKDCFCETYQQVGGKNHVVSKQRFNQAYSEMIRGKFTDYDSFVTKIEMYLL